MSLTIIRNKYSKIFSHLQIIFMLENIHSLALYQNFAADVMYAVEFLKSNELVLQKKINNHSLYKKKMLAFNKFVNQYNKELLAQEKKSKIHFNSCLQDIYNNVLNNILKQDIRLIQKTNPIFNVNTIETSYKELLLNAFQDLLIEFKKDQLIIACAKNNNALINYWYCKFLYKFLITRKAFLIKHNVSLTYIKTIFNALETNKRFLLSIAQMQKRLYKNHVSNEKIYNTTIRFWDLKTIYKDFSCIAVTLNENQKTFSIKIK